MPRIRVLFASGMPAAAVVLETIARHHAIVALATMPSVLRQRSHPLMRARQRVAPAASVTAGAWDELLPEQGEAALDAAEGTIDLAVVYGYGRIVPIAELQLPRWGCVNIHPSALPRWRGAAPIERGLMAGDSTTDICLMHMTAGLDDGPVWARETLPIKPSTTASALYAATARIGAEQVLAHIDAMARGDSRQPTPQLSTPAIPLSYATKLTPADELLNWRAPAAQTVNQIRALEAGSGCYGYLNDCRLAIFGASADGNHLHGSQQNTTERQAWDDNATADEAGMVVAVDRKRGVVVRAGDGACVTITELQRPGKRRMKAIDFLNGFPVRVGDRWR
ncbi:MAG: hypothetical protein K0U36_06545 [Alphaproteobacteria bacterium]|nr:hypothetical protein [Alphaproteobacteria bacterium]